jgi:hypothetical protein
MDLKQTIVEFMDTTDLAQDRDKWSECGNWNFVFHKVCVGISGDGLAYSRRTFRHGVS